MKSLHKLLIVAGAAMILFGAVAVPVLYSQVSSCCHWEGVGDGEYRIYNDTIVFAEYWHATVAWPATDTSRDTIIGCWYDDRGHGGNLYGYRVRATDVAYGVMYANDTEDPYCAEEISVVPDPPISVNWSGDWTGCCDEENPDVDCDWSSLYGSGSFWNETDSCLHDENPNCE